MPNASPAVKIRLSNVDFLTINPFSAANVRGYIASIEGYLWGKTDGVSAGYRNRLDAVKNDGELKRWLGERDSGAEAWAPHNVDDGGMALVRPLLLQLDHIAFDIKNTSGDPYLCTPITANVPKQLTCTTQSVRDNLNSVINLFNENSCVANQAPIQTVVHLPPPNTTFRIDRENLSAPPAPRYWTYRLQNGGDTNGGILMEIDIDFSIDALRAVWRTSLQSVPLRIPGAPALGNGNYVRCSAPAWLRSIVTA
ncbi:MAG TPA: hypothetical protein VFR37_17235 [Longimicrobium sp.]|nr:hypothetical protein [Longimicrobium sp.]